MALLFSSIFVWADPLMGLVDAAVGSWLGNWSKRRCPTGALRSLLVDGVIGGVGAVVIFLPQILILFFFIALLEDCGYMARAAFLMDRLMAGVGLSGKSFIPLLSSFACAIPGIMATRTIENRRDRLATILDRAADELLGAVAGVRDSDRRVRAGGAIPGRSGRAARADAAGDVLGRRDGGDRRGLGAEADDLARARRRRSCWSCRATRCRRCETSCTAWPSGAGRSSPRRDDDLRGDGGRLGPGLLPAGSTSRWRSRSRTRGRSWPASGATAQELAAFDDPDHLDQLAGQLAPADTASSAGPVSGSSRPCGRWAGTGGSAAR